MRKLGPVFSALFIAGSLSLSSPASAVGTISSVLIANIQILGSTTTYAVLQVAGVASGTASCAANPRIAMAIDISTTKGRAVLSTATAAMLANKKITLVGTGMCATPPGLISLELIDKLQMVN